MPYDYKDKRKNINQLNKYMLAKTLSMFEYENLPETMPAREFEKLLQSQGFAFVAKVDGEIYALNGGLGGVTDAYGNATLITIANPYLKYYATLDVKKDGVLVRNDDMQMGLLQYFEKQNTLLAESDINMVVWGYNSRTQKLISAPDDKTKESADLYMKKIIDGDLSIIGENTLFDGIKLQSTTGGANVTITQMVEFNQYLKASMYNEVGLSANFNMKRERLISSELDASEDSLFPLVYNMMENRLKAVKAINEMFGTNIKVGFGSVWALKNKELVDGVVDNGQLPDATNTGSENNVTDSTTDVSDNGKPDEQESGTEQNGNGKPEQTNADTGTDNGNDNGSENNVTDSTTDVSDNGKPDEQNGNGKPEQTNADTGTDNGNDNGSEGKATDPDLNVDNNPDNGKNEDEQEQRQSDNQNSGKDSGDDSESEKTVEELQAVIDCPDSSDEDKQAARELIEELKNEKV